MTDVFSGVFSNTVNAIHNRQAAQALAGNDYAGAMSNLARIGNVDGVNRLRTQQQQELSAAQIQQQEQAARSVAFARQATRAITRTMQDGGDPLATFDQIAPAMQSLGATPEQVSQYRQSLAQNPQGFIQNIVAILDAEERKLQVVNFGSGLGAAVVDERTGQEVNRINPSYRPVGDVLYDPANGTVVFDARQPTYQTIRNADGSTSVVAIDPSPIAGGAPSAPAVAGSGANGADIYAITMQSESGGRDYDGSGNILTSSRGAQGRMQVMPGTQTDPGYGVRPAANNSPDELARVGRDYLDAMVAKYGGDMEKAWAAYNWGPGNLDAAIAARGDNWMSAAPAETRNYVASNMAQLQGGAQPSSPRSRPSAQGGTRVVAQGAPETRGTEYTMLTAEEKRAAGLPETGTYQRNNRTGQITAVAGGSGPGNDRKGEADLRKEFNARAEVKDFNVIRSAYENVRAAGANPSAAGDLSMIFAYMKLLDPGSVVREQEFANAQNAAGVPDQVRNMYNRALNGQRLNPNQRQDFISQAERLYGARRQTYDQIVNEYRGYAQDYGFDPNRVVNASPAPQEGPRLSFQPSEQQLAWVRQNRPSSSSAKGSMQNPHLLNPTRSTQSFNNVPSGEYFIAPDGLLRRKP